MKYSDFDQALDDAQKFIQDNDIVGVSFDSIVTMCYVTSLMARGSSSGSSGGSCSSSSDQLPASAHALTATATTPPKWFADALPKFAGQKVTSSTLLAALGKPTDISSTRAAGAWLRQLVGEPTRSNGQIVFLIELRGTPPADGAISGSPIGESDEIDVENPYHPSIPLASRVTAYAAANYGARVTAKQVAMVVGVEAHKDNLSIIWGELEKIGRQQSDHSFILSKR